MSVSVSVFGNVSTHLAQAPARARSKHVWRHFSPVSPPEPEELFIQFGFLGDLLFGATCQFGECQFGEKAVRKGLSLWGFGLGISKPKLKHYCRGIKL